VYYPFVHKREGFKHENELRAVTIINEAVMKAAASGTPMEVELSEGGIAIPVDVSTLVESIYIAPTAPGWFPRVARRIRQWHEWRRSQHLVVASVTPARHRKIAIGEGPSLHLDQDFTRPRSRRIDLYASDRSNALGLASLVTTHTKL
jgi:hypothetical protein